VIRDLRFLTITLLALVAACGGATKHVKEPSTDRLSSPLVAAFREEAIGDQAKAVGLYANALDRAAQTPDDPSSVAVMMASLDALVHRNVNALSSFTASSALSDRIDPAALAKSGGSIESRLAHVQANAKGPFAAPLIARARLALAERRGDIDATKMLRNQTGCVREATVTGPVAWAPVSGVHQPSDLDRADAPLPRLGPRLGPFAPGATPAVVHALGCRLPLFAESSVSGVREVVVDVDVKAKGIIGIGLESPAAASLRAGGILAIDRATSAGTGAVVRFARVEVDRPGTLRLVARVGDAFSMIGIGAWDENGKPLRAQAPTSGSRANASATRATMITASSPKTADDVLTVSLGLLAAKEGRDAESLLYPELARATTPPELLLAYGRAVLTVKDLPSATSIERAQSAFDRVLDAWPSAWEAVIEHAALAGARRSTSEACFEALADLDKTLSKRAVSAPAIAAAFEAATAGRESLYDRAAAAFDRAKMGIPNTLLLRDSERLTFARTGREDAAFECDAHSAADRTTLACYGARITIGDRQGASVELEHLRALAGSSQLYLSLSSRAALETGDIAQVARDVSEMNPGDRTLAVLYAAKGDATVPEILKLASITRDALRVLPGILRASGDNPLAAWDGVAEKVTSESNIDADRDRGAATEVLAHDETYIVDERGLVHFVMFDVRRVMGTTDVEANAAAARPVLHGKSTMSVLRRRIFKKDGRILLPDRTPNAAQDHADLSQLEAGDAVEAIYEGFALPAGMGNIGIDTPDLLPERTAVQSARIELRLPRGLQGSLWSHPMLGSAQERSDEHQRVLVWTIKNQPVRRIESGVPKMDRNVAVSFSTTQWADVARGLENTMESLDTKDPEVMAWAREAANGMPKSRALVEAVVAKSGQTVKEASGVALANMDLESNAGQTMTARTVLTAREGSRTLLIVQALRDLGIPTDVVIAENEPLSDSASFPPHLSRFMHPLAIAHVPDPNKPGVFHETWIDADVSGPPLPAGRISPELRGRSALFADGRIQPLPAIAISTERDEIDEHLVVDDQGNAKGVITVLLRGRAAQDLAEALVNLVGLERQRALRGIALGFMPFATVDKVELTSSEGSWQIAVRAEFTAPAYAQIEGQKAASRTWVLPGMDPIHHVFPRPYVSTLASSYATEAARESALAILRATQYRVRRRIELPENAKIVRAPISFDGKGPLLSASRKFQITGTNIEEDFTLEISTGTVAREHYEQFVNAAQRTDDAFRASTRVKWGRTPAP